MNSLKLSCNLTGYDYEDVKQQNHKSKSRITTYAIVMLIPMIIWFINGIILGNRLFELNVLFSIVVGLILCIIIWIFERSIIQLEKSKYLKWLRVVLGVLFALLGSFLLDEIIFQNDIHNEVMLIKKEEEKRNLQEFDNKHQQALNEMNSQIAQADNYAKTKQTEATKEADGTGGTNTIGYSRVAKHKQDVANEAKTQTASLQSKKLTIQAEHQKNRLEEKKAFQTGFKENSLLLNMTAMFRVVYNNPGALIIWLLFTLLLAAFEFLVIIIKIVSSPTDYEDSIDLISDLKKYELNSIRENNIRMLQAGITPYYNENNPNFQKA